MKQLAILFVFVACLLSSIFAQFGCETCSMCICPEGTNPPPSSSKCSLACNQWTCSCPDKSYFNCINCTCYGRPDRDNGNHYRGPDEDGWIRGFNCDCSGCQ
ncbi:14862_t:CDS:2 [Funneliformis caledonium]|uniref:14862_t:CDS:1 n=1 Tax=Funneliformis caledonium TaxID=1117310 RepID=A0A9N9N8N9_9GLOM|nr:14862_t:CDS:2 [Funneliformis caledonium]